jgi:TPP-dependent trihydroxycyclohexane-1,2-dione (THcHDO) dehydratase
MKRLALGLSLSLLCFSLAGFIQLTSWLHQTAQAAEQWAATDSECESLAHLKTCLDQHDVLGAIRAAQELTSNQDEEAFRLDQIEGVQP